MGGGERCAILTSDEVVMGGGVSLSLPRDGAGEEEKTAHPRQIGSHEKLRIVLQEDYPVGKSQGWLIP